MSKPDPKDVLPPWVIKDCECGDKIHCDVCDGYGWYYRDADTGFILSEMMRDAFDRHG